MLNNTQTHRLESPCHKLVNAMGTRFFLVDEGINFGERDEPKS